MIELTVKTLNSVNHPFTVPDETTVKQLKERIRDKLGIAIQDQRLIFCGRVLQDAKLLSEFGVDGKVLHLVERMPPNTSSNSQSGGATTTTPPTNSGNGQQFRRVMFPLNQELESALFLEALAVPSMLAEVATGSQGQASSTGDRLDFVRRMIQEIKRKLNALDYRQDANETYSSLSGDSDLDESNDENNDEHMDTENSMDANGEALQDEAMAEDHNADQNPEDHNMSFESQSSMGTGESGDSTRRGADMQFELADILQELDMLQHRLVPLTQTLLDVLRPLSPEEQRSTRQTRREQRQVELAFETFHSMAHVYHALSDLNITVDGRHSHLSSEQVSLRHAMPIQTSINFLSNQPRPTQAGADRANAEQSASTGAVPQGTGANEPGSETTGQPTAQLGPNPNAQPNTNARPEPVSYHLEIETRVPLAVALSNGWINNPGQLNTQRQAPTVQNQARPSAQAGQDQAASGQTQSQGQAQPQAQAQPQGQSRPQAQVESQGQAQPRAQAQTQGQARGQTQSQSGQPKAPNQPSSGNQSSQSTAPNVAPTPQGNANAGAGRSGSFGRQGRPPPANLMDMMADITMAMHPPPPVPPELQALGEAHMMTGPIPLPIPDDPVQSFLHTLMHRSGLMGPLLASVNGLNAAANRAQNANSPGQNASSPGQNTTNPAQNVTSPGQTTTNTGQNATTPGQTVVTPGQTVVNPEQSAASAATTTQGGTRAKRDTGTSTEETAANSAQTTSNVGPTATTPVQIPSNVGPTATTAAQTTSNVEPTATNPGQTTENQGPPSGPNTSAGQGPIYVTSRQPAGFTAINIPVNISGQGNFRLATPILNTNSRPGQRVIRNQIPTINSLLFDRFLPCDSAHIRRRQQTAREEGAAGSRHPGAPNNAEQQHGPGPRPQCRYHYSNTWIRDIIDIFLHEFTFEELMLSLQGTTLAYDEIREPLRQYVESVLVPPEPSPDSYETPIDEAYLHAAGDLMRQHAQFLRQLALVLPLRAGIDVAASYRSLVYMRLPHMFRAIMNTDPDSWSYNRRFHEAMLAFFTEIAALTYYVTNNSYVGVSVMITNLFEEIASGFAPLFRVWVIVMVRLALDYIREALPGLADAVTVFVVLTNGRRMNQRSLPPPPGLIEMSAPPEFNEMSVPPGFIPMTALPGFLPMSTPPTRGFEGVHVAPPNPAQEPHLAAGRHPQLVSESIEISYQLELPSGSQTSSPEEETNASGDQDNSDPAWTEFPNEWVPVIRQDEERQVASLTGTDERQPLSDAYLTGMASRKRKIVQQARPPESLDALLHESIVEAVGDREEADELIAAEGEALRELCREELRALGRQRLEGSEDYAPAEFPAAHRFYFADRSSNEDATN